MKNCVGKVVLITGASSGIGRALAREMARRRANLVLAGRREDRLSALAAELSATGVRAIPCPCDVTRDGELERVVALAVKELGRLDIVVANAGFGVVGDVERLTLDDYRRQFETNVLGVIRTARAAIPELKKTRGSLVLVGSVNGYVSLPGNSPYAMSKYAVRALAEALKLELAPYGVAVTHIAPGFVESEIRTVDNKGFFHVTAKDPIPHWLVMPTDKAARRIADAIISRRRERVITGHGKLVVWLVRHFPSFVYFAMAAMRLKARGQP
jgi:short-subunit dehydrogenase